MTSEEENLREELSMTNGRIEWLRGLAKTNAALNPERLADAIALERKRLREIIIKLGEGIT